MNFKKLLLIGAGAGSALYFTYFHNTSQKISGQMLEKEHQKINSTSINYLNSLKLHNQQNVQPKILEKETMISFIKEAKKEIFQQCLLKRLFTVNAYFIQNENQIEDLSPKISLSDEEIRSSFNKAQGRCEINLEDLNYTFQVFAKDQEIQDKMKEIDNLVESFPHQNFINRNDVIPKKSLQLYRDLLRGQANLIKMKMKEQKQPNYYEPKLQQELQQEASKLKEKIEKDNNLVGLDYYPDDIMMFANLKHETENPWFKQSCEQSVKNFEAAFIQILTNPHDSTIDKMIAQI